MFLEKFKNNLVIGLILISFVAGCSTQLEERASMDFEPTMPSISKSPKKDKYGSIYSNSQQGLFATDRRASKVGDLLTVALSENFSASKSQSAKSLSVVVSSDLGVKIFLKKLNI